MKVIIRPRDLLTRAIRGEAGSCTAIHASSRVVVVTLVFEVASMLLAIHRVLHTILVVGRDALHASVHRDHLRLIAVTPMRFACATRHTPLERLGASKCAHKTIKTSEPAQQSACCSELDKRLAHSLVSGVQARWNHHASRAVGRRHVAKRVRTVQT